jgi:hypothetical protein
MIKKFSLFETVDDMYDFSSADYSNIFKSDLNNEDLNKIKKVAKNGKLYNQLSSGKKLTFGVLKALHSDALKFKENREYLQGFYKFLHRAIPLALAYVYFPLWILSQFLGGSRALIKVAVPVMQVKKVDYKSFMSGIITKAIDISEGEVVHFFDDWFYKSFAVEKGLINMVRREHIISFAYMLATKMEKENDDKIVPPYYVENEFRRYLNREFKISPPLPMKREKEKLSN